MSDKNQHGKHHVRTLIERDSEGRERSTHIVYDFAAMLRDAFPELKEAYEKEQAEKPPGELIPFKSNK